MSVPNPPGPVRIRRSQIRRRAAYAAAALALVGGLGLGIPMWLPLGPLGAASPMAWVHDARALARLASPRPDAADLAAAEAESRAALASAPADDSAWLKLAGVDRVRHGRLTPVGLEALRRSYDAAPFGPDTSEWRVRFALDNWSALDGGLREAVLDELRASWTQKGWKWTALAPQLSDPSGRMALRLLIAQQTRAKSAAGPP